MFKIFLFVYCFLVLMLPSGNALAGDKVISIGYFPNITHAHALISQNMASEGQDWFERYLPPNFKVKPSIRYLLFSNSQ